MTSALQHHRLSHSSSLCRRGCLWPVLGDVRSLFTASSIGHTVNIVTPRSTVVLERLTFPRLRSYSLHFMEPELSLPCLQDPVHRPYPQPDKVRLTPSRPYFCSIQFNIFPISLYVFQGLKLARWKLVLIFILHCSADRNKPCQPRVEHNLRTTGLFDQWTHRATWSQAAEGKDKREHAVAAVAISN